MPQNNRDIRFEFNADCSKIKKELEETEAALKNTAASVSELLSALDSGGRESVFSRIAEDAENAQLAVSKAADGLAESTASLEAASLSMDSLLQLFSGSDIDNIAAAVFSSVRSEQESFPAAAYSASAQAPQNLYASEADCGRKCDIAAVLENINKPVQVMLDGKVIAETVMTYQNNYMRKTGE